MEIIQAIMTENPSYKRNRAIHPIGILVHSTGANNRTLKRYVNAPDRLGRNQYGNHWNKANATKSVHAFIGLDKDGEVIVAQTLPYDRACWGAGGGKKGSANYDPQARLQFEICQGSNEDKDYYWRAIAVAEEYCAYLCGLYGWTAANITSHKEAHAAGYASNHGDPVSWMRHFGDSMDKFRARVQARLDGQNGPQEPPKITVEQIPAQDATSAPAVETEGKTVKVELNTLRQGSKGAQVKTVQRQLNGLGHACGAVDGIFGSKTVAAVKALQKAKGLNADGVVGAQTWGALLK